MRRKYGSEVHIGLFLLTHVFATASKICRYGGHRRPIFINVIIIASAQSPEVVDACTLVTKPLVSVSLASHHKTRQPEQGGEYNDVCHSQVLHKLIKKGGGHNYLHFSRFIFPSCVRQLDTWVQDPMLSRWATHFNVIVVSARKRRAIFVFSASPSRRVFKVLDRLLWNAAIHPTDLTCRV
jgi:hypothetical protein